jgi:hypothetical protein
MPDFSSWCLSELILIGWVRIAEVLGTIAQEDEPGQLQDRRGKGGIQLVYSCDASPNFVLFIKCLILC